MYLTSTKTRKAIAIFTLAMGAATSPVVGYGVSECYDRVLQECNDALEQSNYLEKVAVGLMCTGMLAGCGFEAI